MPDLSELSDTQEEKDMANRGINKVILVGNLGADPEIRYMPNGNAVCNLSVATSESWKDKQSGEAVERTEWHRVVLFGKIAEIAGEYLKKGTQAYFEGRLQTRKWQDKNGQDRYTTEIIATDMHMLGGRSQITGTAPQFADQEAPVGAPSTTFEDDIPF